MDKKYQIFVSSTYVDLIEERQQVMRAILNMGHIPIGMEQFKAGDEAQWKVIQRHIDSSDYYIIIIAHRYGSTIPRSGISYTEKEYDYAVKQGIPALGFIIDKGISWPPQHIEADQQKKDRLDKFRSKVMKKPVQFWKSADDLFGKVAIALPETITIQPRTGWVRGDSGIGPEVAEELARLSKENSILVLENTKISQELEIFKTGNQITDKTLQKKFKIKLRLKCYINFHGRNELYKEEAREFETSVEELLKIFYKTLISNEREYSLILAITNKIKETDISPFTDVDINYNEILPIVEYLILNNYINRNKHSNGDYLSLTDNGRIVILKIMKQSTQ